MMPEDESSDLSDAQADTADATGKLPVTREQLYDYVWAEPMLKVAARYKVSSSFLARVCTQLNVPRPARGYWAKLAVGIQSPRPPLSETRPGDLLEWSRDGNPKRVPTLKIIMVLSDVLEDHSAISAKHFCDIFLPKFSSLPEVAKESLKRTHKATQNNAFPR